MIQKDGLNFVRLYFLNYTWYVNDLHNIWKFRTSSFKCYVDHLHTMCSSGNIDVRNWVHLFESPCILVYVCMYVSSNDGNIYRLLAVFWWQACAWWPGRPSQKTRTSASLSPLPLQHPRPVCRGCTRHTRISARCARAWSLHTKGPKHRTRPHPTK